MKLSNDYLMRQLAEYHLMDKWHELETMELAHAGFPPRPQIYLKPEAQTETVHLVKILGMAMDADRATKIMEIIQESPVYDTGYSNDKLEEIDSRSYKYPEITNVVVTYPVMEDHEKVLYEERLAKHRQRQQEITDWEQNTAEVREALRTLKEQMFQYLSDKERILDALEQYWQITNSVGQSISTMGVAFPQDSEARQDAVSEFRQLHNDIKVEK